MTARLARVLVSTGAAALALGLVAPSAALAEDGNGNGKSGDKGAKKSSASTAKGDKGDPAGNNGTIKIQPFGGIDGNRNTPHPGCDFRLQMFGFDDDQTGTITFVGQAPTKGAVTQQPLAGKKLLSDDAAGGGKDKDAFYDVRGASLGLTGTPAKQGFHIKVLVDADNAPGGAKQKVFWLDCAPAAAATTGSTGGAGTVTTNKVESTETTKTVTSGVTEGAAAAETTTTRSSQASRRVVAQNSTAGETAFTGGAATAVRPTTTSAERGGALPFTGLPLPALLAIAFATLGAGALAIWAGRRRSGLV